MLPSRSSKTSPNLSLLSCRLFRQLLADELVVAVLAFLVFPLIVPCRLMFLRSVTIAIQALIFATLAGFTYTVRPSRGRPTDPIGRSLASASGPPSS